MEQFVAFSVKLAGKPAIGQALRQTVAAVGAPDDFYVAGEFRRKTTAQAVQARFPELGACVDPTSPPYNVSWRTRPWGLFGDKTAAPARFPALVGPAPDLDALLRMSDLLPKDVPATRSATFVWWANDLLGAPNVGVTERWFDQPFSSYLAPEPRLALYLDLRGRLTLQGWARPALPTTPSPRAKPTLAEAAHERLSAIGKVVIDGLSAFESPAEVLAHSEARRAAQALLNEVAGTSVELPHALVRAPEALDLNPLSHDHRADGDRAFAPLGYRANAKRGRPGLLVWSRTLGSHHVVDLILDVGTRSRRAALRYEVAGIDGVVWTAVRFAGRAVDDYPVNSDADYARVMDNAAVCVAALDASVDRVAALMPATPAGWRG